MWKKKEKGRDEDRDRDVDRGRSVEKIKMVFYFINLNFKFNIIQMRLELWKCVIRKLFVYKMMLQYIVKMLIFRENYVNGRTVFFYEYIQRKQKKF